MPNHQRHRGQHSEDIHLFHEKWIPVLCQAVRDFSYLLSLGYPENASLKLVGDRFRLSKRQRKAVMRSGCTNQAVWARQQKVVAAHTLKGKSVAIDAYNILISTESLLSDGILILCRDGCYRDMASLHGTYRRVEETNPAIELIGKTLSELEVTSCAWYLDSPISNSGRLKQRILNIAEENTWDWEAELVLNPDKVLAVSKNSIISSDSWVLDQTQTWFNLMDHLITQKKQKANIKKLK